MAVIYNKDVGLKWSYCIVPSPAITLVTTYLGWVQPLTTMVVLLRTGCNGSNSTIRCRATMAVPGVTTTVYPAKIVCNGNEQELGCSVSGNTDHIGCNDISRLDPSSGFNAGASWRMAAMAVLYRIYHQNP